MPSTGAGIPVRPEEWFRILVEQAADGIFIASPDGHYLLVNVSGNRLLGYEPGELIGKHLTDLLLPGDQVRLGQAIAALRRGEVLTQEWKLRRKDGSAIEVELSAQQLDNGSLLAIARDLGPRRAAEEQLTKSEAQLRSIVQTAPDVIMAVDRRGKILFINRTLPPLSPEQVVGTNCFDYVPADARPRVEAALDHVFSTRSIDEYETRGPPDPNGVRVWSSVRAGPWVEGDQVIAAILCATDVTARRQEEERLRELEEHLRQAQKVESIGKLAGGVAHDFNNLLTSVLGFIDLARGEVAPDSPVAEYLTGAMQAAERGAVLTQQLLAFARKKIVRPTALDLNETLQRMASMLRRLVGEELTLDLLLSPTKEVVKVDAGSIEQVIMNLVVNARDAIQGAGRIALQTRHVTLDDDTCRRLPDLTAGDYVTLSVSDTGTGMPPDVVARLFEPFFTTKPVGQGTGLGLAMCHGIVRQAGGTIAVESQLGAGSLFRVYLPRAPDVVETQTAHPELGPRARGHETLLIVEDETTILRMASTALRALGYRVLTAADGVEAIEVVQNAADRVHLVFTDVVMPRMGGAELAARLRDLRPGIRVLFSSGHTEDSIVERGVLQDGVDFLQKPYTPATLARKIRELLDRARP